MTNPMTPPPRPGMHPTAVHVSLPLTGYGQPMDRWEFHDDALKGLEWLMDFDHDAYDYLVTNLETWADEGYANFTPDDTSNVDLVAPAGRNIRREIGPERPYMCEAKTCETNPKHRSPLPKKRQWRLYFIDVTSLNGELDHMMAAVHYAEKWVHATMRREVRRRQDKNMQDAAEIALAWCESCGRDYRREEEII